MPKKAPPLNLSSTTPFTHHLHGFEFHYLAFSICNQHYLAAPLPRTIGGTTLHTAVPMLLNFDAQPVVPPNSHEVRCLAVFAPLNAAAIKNHPYLIGISTVWSFGWTPVFRSLALHCSSIFRNPKDIS